MVEAQVFVKIESYKDVLNVIGLVKEKMANARETLDKIKDLKHQEDSELQSWETKLNEIESKIGEIDKTLFEPVGM